MVVLGHLFLEVVGGVSHHVRGVVRGLRHGRERDRRCDEDCDGLHRGITDRFRWEDCNATKLIETKRPRGAHESFKTHVQYAKRKVTTTMGDVAAHLLDQ